MPGEIKREDKTGRLPRYFTPRVSCRGRALLGSAPLGLPITRQAPVFSFCKIGRRCQVHLSSAPGGLFVLAGLDTGCDLTDFLLSRTSGSVKRASLLRLGHSPV